MNLSADTLGFINSLQDNLLGTNNPISSSNINPTVAQSGVHNLANAAITPFQNASNNFTKTISDFKNPQGDMFNAGLTDAGDLYNLKHNPFGNQNQQSMQAPKLADEHLGPANPQGNRPVLPSGYDQLKNFGIGDNTSLLSPQAPVSADMGIQPPTSTKQPSMLGNVAKGAVMDAGKDAALTGTGVGGAVDSLGSEFESLLALL